MATKTAQHSETISKPAGQIFCDPCRFNGSITLAVKSCQDCVGNLCQHCVILHMQNMNTKNHVTSFIILENTGNGNIKMATTRHDCHVLDASFEEHSGETNQQKRDRESVGNNHYQGNSGIQSILEPEHDLEDIASTETRVKDLQGKFEDILNVKQANLQHLNQLQETFVNALKAHRHTLNSLLDKLEQSMMKKANRHFDSKSENIQSCLDTTEAAIVTLNDSLTKLDIAAQEGDADTVFLALKTVHAVTQRLEKVYSEVKEQQKHFTFYYQPDVAVEKFLKSLTELGSLREDTSKHTVSLKAGEARECGISKEPRRSKFDKYDNNSKYDHRASAKVNDTRNSPPEQVSYNTGNTYGRNLEPKFTPTALNKVKRSQSAREPRNSDNDKPRAKYSSVSINSFATPLKVNDKIKSKDTKYREAELFREKNSSVCKNSIQTPLEVKDKYNFKEPKYAETEPVRDTSKYNNVSKNRLAMSWDFNEKLENFAKESNSLDTDPDRDGHGNKTKNRMYLSLDFNDKRVTKDELNNEAVKCGGKDYIPSTKTSLEIQGQIFVKERKYFETDDRNTDISPQRYSLPSYWKLDDDKLIVSEPEKPKVCVDTTPRYPSGDLLYQFPTKDTSMATGQMSSRRDTDTQASPIELNVRLPSDKKACSITGSTFLADDRIVITDVSNKKVKVFGADLKPLAFLETISAPRDVTSMTSSSEAAFTIPNEKSFQIITIGRNAISVNRTIKLDVECYGICHHGNEFYLASGWSADKEILVVDYDGIVLRTLKTNNEVLKCPLYVTVEPTTSTVYVSDYDHGVVGIDMSGHVVYRYNDPSTNGYMGLCSTPDGNVYICTFQPNGVSQVRTNNNRQRPMSLITSKDNKLAPLIALPNKGRPRAVAYNTKTNNILISFVGENVDMLSIYQL